MSKTGSAQTLDHEAGRPSPESGRTPPMEKLSWSLFDEKAGPFGGMAALGSQSAWEAQMECVLKVLILSYHTNDQDIYNYVKANPLQQAQPTPSNDSTGSMTLKPGLGLTRSASIMSQLSQLSDNGSAKPRKLNGRDWLGRSKSQPRLPLHPQDSYVSIASDRSSIDDRTRSPPTSQPKVPHPINSI